MSGKTALVTGSASGIGRAVALRMAKEGYTVAVADINPDGAEAVVREIEEKGGRALAIRMDVTSETDVVQGFDRTVEAFGSVDFCMINAGVQIVHPFDEYPFEDWKRLMAIHADGAFLCSREAFRQMKASGRGGHIVFTGSVHSYIGSPMKEPYSFAKHGYIGLAKAIAKEGAVHRIYTYTICPSFIRTALVDKQIPELAEGFGITEEEVIRNVMLKDTVDGVFTTVEDVADMAAYLAKDNGALTGQSIMLTHGWHMI